MNNGNIKRITALFIVMIMLLASAACSCKPNSKKFLKDFEKWMDRLAGIITRAAEDPADSTLREKLDKMCNKLKAWEERADMLKRDMTEDEIEKFDEELRKIFSKIRGSVSDKE